ncbi:hypothetical protein GIB67_032138, partial [Kingdonia uniflora]
MSLVNVCFQFTPKRRKSFGSAGIGVVNAARKTMARMSGNNESALESAKSQFWVVDANGLITEDHANIDPEALPFAQKAKEVGHQGLSEGASLVEVVRQIKPDVLLGLSAVGGLFSKEVLEALKGSTSTRPAIFAMSNPTRNAECTPKEAFSIVGDHIVFASGSPFKDVDLGNGRSGHCNQGNNMYLFPGIVLGTLLSGSHIISDGMLQAAAECLAAYMTEDEVLNGAIYPSISSIRDIMKEVATAVVTEAIKEDLAEGYRDMDARELQKLSQWGEWIPYYETNFEDEHFKVDNPMSQEDLKEVANMFNKILSQSPPNSALNIQLPMPLSIPSPIEPHQFIEDFSDDEVDDKFLGSVNSTSILEQIRVPSLSQPVSPSSFLFLKSKPPSPEPNGGTMTINNIEDLYGDNSCYISVDEYLNYLEDSNDPEIHDIVQSLASESVFQLGHVPKPMNIQ